MYRYKMFVSYQKKIVIMSDIVGMFTSLDCTECKWQIIPKDITKTIFGRRRRIFQNSILLV